MVVYLTWENFKIQILDKGRVRYNDRGDFYHLTYKDDAGIFESTVIKDSGADQIDFETNYKNLANKKLAGTDDDGAAIARPKAAKKGWTYFMCPIEFKTSDLDSVYSKNPDGTDRTTVTYKIYNSNDEEITDSAYENTAVKTVVDFEPSYDYEIIGGDLIQISNPGSDLRVWVIGVPDLAPAYGGSKEMCGGVNFKFIAPYGAVRADGRVAKYMPYNGTYHTSKLRLILKHSAGLQHDIMLVLEMFRE